MFIILILASAEFAVNSIIYSATKVSSFTTNYKRKLRIGVDIRKKRKIEKVTKFAAKMKEEAETILK